MRYSTKSINGLSISSVQLFCMTMGFFLFPVYLSAAVKMVLRLEHPVVLKNETLNAFLTIENDTDKLLIIDEKQSGTGSAMKLDFDVYIKKHENLSRRVNRPIVPEMNLIPGDKRVLMIDMTKFYDVSREGRYIIGAVLAGNGKEITSNKESTDVVPGLELASVVREVPGYEDEKRKISVRYWNRHQKEVVFVCVDDEENNVNYGVFQLGVLLRITKPSIKYERSGHFIVTHQCRGDCFVLTSFLLTRSSVTCLEQSYVTHDGKPYTMKESTKGRLIEELKKKKEPENKK